MLLPDYGPIQFYFILNARHFVHNVIASRAWELGPGWITLERPPQISIDCYIRNNLCQEILKEAVRNLMNYEE